MFLLMDQMQNMLKNQINKKYAPYLTLAYNPHQS